LLCEFPHLCLGKSLFIVCFSINRLLQKKSDYWKKFNYWADYLGKNWITWEKTYNFSRYLIFSERFFFWIFCKTLWKKFGYSKKSDFVELAKISDYFSFTVITMHNLLSIDVIFIFDWLQHGSHFHSFAIFRAALNMCITVTQFKMH
jgi:hypothetical protein